MATPLRGLLSKNFALYELVPSTELQTLLPATQRKPPGQEERQQETLGKSGTRHQEHPTLGSPLSSLPSPGWGPSPPLDNSPSLLRTPGAGRGNVPSGSLHEGTCTVSLRHPEFWEVRPSVSNTCRAVLGIHHEQPLLHVSGHVRVGLKGARCLQEGRGGKEKNSPPASLSSQTLSESESHLPAPLRLRLQGSPRGHAPSGRVRERPRPRPRPRENPLLQSEAPLSHRPLSEMRCPGL